MDQVTCGKCGATFDATAELPQVFTCGNCGAEVMRPVRPARAAPAARRRAAPKHHSYREELEAAAKKDKTLIFVAIGAGVLLVAGAAFFFFNSSSKTPDVVPPSAQPAPPPPVVVETKPPPIENVPKEPVRPPDVAEAPKPEPEPEPEETGSRELVRLKLAAKRAGSAQEHFDAGKLGVAQLAAVRKATPGSAEIPEFEQRIKAAFEKAVRVDPDFAPAHLELGHVRYSASETAAWVKSDRVPEKLRTALEETIGSLDRGRDVVWLSDADALKHSGVLAEAQLLHEDRTTTKVNWFYEKARKSALFIEGQIGVYLSEARDKDAFDPVVFRPYLLMVQKDPKQSSVDRAYEVVLLIRTLEETWRRRYAKEIEFSGSMSAPPIILLRSQKDYAKYLQRHETKPVLSAGHYEPAERRMVIYKSTPEEERNVIFHEGTHMLFDHKNSAKDGETQGKQSMWFSEGIAEYFGGHGPSGERDPATQSVIYEPGRINDTRIGSIKIARAVKKLIKFEDLIKITRAEWSVRNVKDHLWAEMTYAQGWALVYYLNHADSGKYQKDFVEYMKLELTGKSGMDTFQSVFGKHGLDKIEKGYTDFLEHIIKKYNEKKIVGGKILD